MFARLSAERAQTYSLVLSAVGIEHRTSHKGPMWSVSVEPAQRKSAIETISLYLKENPPQAGQGRAPASAGVRTYSGWYVSAVLMMIHVLIAPGADQRLFVDHFGADAGQIAAGRIYRCVTAMLLHADMNHLLGNLAGLIIFGGVTASLCGWGLGWLMLLAAGFFANLATAFWYQHNHLSIGASTAVFAAVGICAVLSFSIRRWNKADPESRSWRRWMPLAGGLAMLGLMGTSAHADLMAHLLGFVFGLLFGSLAGLRAGRLPYQAPLLVQCLAALSAIAIVVAAWLQGLHYNG